MPSNTPNTAPEAPIVTDPMRAANSYGLAVPAATAECSELTSIQVTPNCSSPAPIPVTM